MRALTVSFGMPYFIRMSIIFLRFIVSNDFEKSMKRNVSGRFLSYTTYNIHIMVRIFPVVDLFLRKPFHIRIWSISGIILFNNIKLYIFADIVVNIIIL